MGESTRAKQFGRHAVSSQRHRGPSGISDWFHRLQSGNTFGRVWRASTAVRVSETQNGEGQSNLPTLRPFTEQHHQALQRGAD